MNNRQNFWSIYKKDAFSSSRIILTASSFLGWYLLVFICLLAGIAQLPKELVMAVPFLLAEFAYLYTCLRKYKAAVG